MQSHKTSHESSLRSSEAEDEGTFVSTANFSSKIEHKKTRVSDKIDKIRTMANHKVCVVSMMLEACLNVAFKQPVW